MSSILQRARQRLANYTRDLKKAQADAAALKKKIKSVKAVIARNSKRVHQPSEQINANVCNQSARTDTIRLIVLHDTESHEQPGTSDLQSLVQWFDNPKAQASSHIIIDQEGTTARCVPDERKAWHVVAYNSQALGIEQVGFATQTDWPAAQVHKAAKWIAWWSHKFGIPITHSTDHGVCFHSDLGVQGGGHHDPGEHYPLDLVLKLARDYLANGW